jgi:hypothetical protein
MKHFEISQWGDFGHQLMAEPEVTAMRLPRCGQFQRQPRGRTPQQDAPPADGVPNVAATLSAAASARSRRSSRLTAELVSDSSLAPRPADPRTTWRVGWQGLYRFGDCLLDLRIEPELNSTRAVAIGQINNHIAPRESMANVPVLLKAGRTVVAETRSNRFGEFQIEYEQHARLQLCVCLGNGARRLQVRLNRSASELDCRAERLGLEAGRLKPKQEEQ